MSYDPNTGEWIDDGIGTAPAENTQVQIPDIGLDTEVAGLQDRVVDEQANIADRTAETNSQASALQYTAPPPESVDLVKDANTFQRPEDMVSNQLTTLLQNDHPYMQAAETRAREKSERYGLLGSSMSIGAAHRAAIESALPIAQQDASTSSKYGLQQQATDNQIALTGAETEYAAELMKHRVQLENMQQSLNNSFEIAAQGLDLEGQAVISDIQGRWQMVTADAQLRLEAALKEKLNIQQIDAEIAASARASASDMIKNYQIATENLLKDPDFLQLGSSAIQNTLNNMLATTTASIQFVADSTGVNLDDYLDDFEINAQFTAEINPPA